MKMFFQHRFKNISANNIVFTRNIQKWSPYVLKPVSYLIFLTSKNQKFFSDPLSYFIYIYISYLYFVFRITTAKFVHHRYSYLWAGPWHRSTRVARIDQGPHLHHVSPPRIRTTNRRLHEGEGIVGENLRRSNLHASPSTLDPPLRCVVFYFW